MGRCRTKGMLPLHQYLQELCDKVCDDLARVHASEQDPGHQGLIFPPKRDFSIRISEQEAKQLFAHHLTLDKRFLFSVETPTIETYQQKGTTPISARVDLTLYHADRKPAVHVELKAHNCTVEAIRKDVEKLLRENIDGMWFHTLRTGDLTTLRALVSKFRSAFALLPECLRTNQRSFLFAFFALEQRVLHWHWMNLSGEGDANNIAVANTFSDDSPIYTWNQKQIPAELGNEQPAFARIVRTAAATGKGRREAFFVFIPTISTDSALHLSIRGGSYRLRQYDVNQPGKRPRAFSLPEHRTSEALRESHIVEYWIPVTPDDYAHNIDDEPAYWVARIQVINRRRNTAPRDAVGVAQISPP